MEVFLKENTQKKEKHIWTDLVWSFCKCHTPLYICPQQSSPICYSSHVLIDHNLGLVRSSHWIRSVKKVLLKILQNSQGNNSCATGSFLIKLQVSGCNFIKKRFWGRSFPVNYAKCLRTLLSPNTTDDCFWLGTSGTRKNEFLYL